MCNCYNWLMNYKKIAGGIFIYIPGVKMFYTKKMYVKLKTLEMQKKSTCYTYFTDTWNA